MAMVEIGGLLANRYRIIKYLGGGMSRVYLAIDEVSMRKLAVKVVDKIGEKVLDKMPPIDHEKHGYGLADKDVQLEAIFREARLLKRLHRKGIANIVDLLDLEEEFIIITEFIEGQNLRTYAKEKAGIGVDQAINIMDQIASILKDLHLGKPGLFFKDLKPSNIIVEKDGSCSLIDFGCADMFGRTANRGLGSKGFAAPEQFVDNGEVDEKSDIFALGRTMLYSLFPGVTFRTREDRFWLFYKNYGFKSLKRSYPFFKGIILGLKVKALARLIYDCIGQDRDDRCQDMAYIQDELGKIRALDERLQLKLRIYLDYILPAMALLSLAGILFFGWRLMQFGGF